MQESYGRCGNNCGHCALFAGNLTSDRRQWVAEGVGTYLNWHPKPETLRGCTGCRTDAGFHYLKNCRVRLCARYNSAETCAHCAVFPCSEVGQVSVDEGYRQTVEERLGRTVPEDGYLAFIEPYEGMKHLRALRPSLGEEEPVAPVQVRPLRARVDPFPENLTVDEEEARGLRAVYDLLTAILQGRAEVYARQLALKLSRKSLLAMLWIFGAHGETSGDGAHLVIARNVRDQEPDFSTFVRKRDNVLHSTAVASIALLANLGANVEHIPQPSKAWLLRLSLQSAAGGPPALRALQRYTAALIEEDGRPDYAGSSGYKGEAFQRFSRADMRVMAAR